MLLNQTITPNILSLPFLTSCRPRDKPDQTIIDNCLYFKCCFEILKQKESRIELVDNRVHTKSGQWEKIVDWLFEIITVFEKSSQIVFMAMGYLDQYIGNSQVSKCGKT